MAGNSNRSFAIRNKFPRYTPGFDGEDLHFSDEHLHPECEFRFTSNVQLEARHVTPQIFETVVATLVFVKDVHHHVAEIGDDPVARRQTVDRVGTNGMILLQTAVEFADDGLQVRFAGRGADHEKVGEAGQSAQIERDDVFGFFVRGDGRAELG